MKTTLKVRLYVRIRRSDGRDAFVEPAWNRNRTLRGGHALVLGQPEHHPESCYYLRYLRNGKRAWESVGTDPEIALVALRKTQHHLESMNLAREPLAPALEKQPVAADQVQPKHLMTEAMQEYLQEVRLFRAPKTIAACENILSRFTGKCSAAHVEDVCRRDLLGHMAALKQEGLSDRTIFNHMTRVNTFLRANGVTGLLRAADKPRYDEKDVVAYYPQELSVLFSEATAEERLLIQFFLGTGFREQEVTYCTWANIDFQGKVVSVRSKPEMRFRAKDKEERSVPIPDSLVHSLALRKRQAGSLLVFPGKGNKPNGHFLRTLQKLAYRAGLNCGECTTKSGRTCTTKPVCRKWGLHSLRRTFATLHSEAGVPPRTIQRWLGHSDLSTTLRYLAVADVRSERTRSQINTTFAGLSMGSAA